MIRTLSIVSALFLTQNFVAGTGHHLVPLRDSVVLTLSSDRQAYYRAERIRLELSIKNISDSSVTGLFELDPALGRARIYYRKGNAEYVRLRCFVRPAGRVALRPSLLGAGEERSDRVDISVVTLEPTVILRDQVGTCQFRVEYEDVPADPNSVLESNLVEIEVVEAAPEEQDPQAAYTPDLAYLAQIPHGADVFITLEEVATAATFIERYRESRYAGPLKEGLIKWLQYRTGTQRATPEERTLFAELTRKADTMAPELHVEVSPATLWPPNHKLVQLLTSIIVTDDQDPSPVVSLVSITCDDSCDPAADIAGAELGTDDVVFELRAERKGSGTGRTYTITYSARDASGNEALATAPNARPRQLQARSSFER